jgi:hypothetical protein
MDALKNFIAHARSKGMDHATIRMLLLSAGWKEKDIAEALAEQGLDMPVPLPPDRGGARDAFLHLLTFAALGTSIFGIITLLFEFINHAFPDPMFDAPLWLHDNWSGVRRSMAALIVAFPLYLWLTSLLVREIRSQPERGAPGVRRWLTYMTLFLAATALMGDVITLIFYLLEGELTARFLSKVLVVLVVSLATFSYYFLSIRAPDTGSPKLHKNFATFAVIIVLASLATGVVLAGTPAAERLRKFDERRFENLQAIDGEISQIVFGDRWGDRTRPLKLEKPLPKTLGEVAAQARFKKIHLQDPQTGTPYEYLVRDETHFELCATFTFQRDQSFDIAWNHPAGRHCFFFDVLESRGPKRPQSD